MPSGIAPADRTPLAIVGIGCRFPGGANDPDSFWQLLSAGRCAIVEAPEERWSSERFYDPDPACHGKTYVNRGGFLRDDPTLFDPAAFGISPREAPFVDPQQRLLLEVAWEALENAGLPADSVAGTPVGVFVGGFTLDYMMLQMSPANRGHISSHTATGLSMTMLSSRISHCLDLRGPCLSVDTACSSSLMAIHLACQSLWIGESHLALAGGVNAMLLPDSFIGMSKGRFLSPDGLCKTFDQRADGYARAEGAGVILICPLDRAVREQRRIWAVINATAVNQDGRTPGITLPSLDAQKELIARAYELAGLAPSEVAYVEAHGTGTAAGDPVEAAAIGAVIGAGRVPGDDCLIGSVKANIGHLEAAAGVAGIIKAALCLNRRSVPPQIHLNDPIPQLSDGLPLRIPTEVQPLPEGPVVAGVNSFGYGGTNVHVVLSSPPTLDTHQASKASHRNSAAAQRSRLRRRPYVLVLSAHSAESLKLYAQRFAEFLRGFDGAIGDACRAAAIQRSHLAYRLAAWGRDKAELLRRLEERLESPAPVTGSAEPVFVFSGMGAQYVGMGTGLAHEPAYADALRVWRTALGAFDCGDWFAALENGEPGTPIDEPRLAQPANLAVQMALSELLESWGIRPVAVLGHSVGELSAAVCAGAIAPRQGAQLCAHRARLQQGLHGGGAMLAAAIRVEDLPARLGADHDEICIAAINGEESVTLAGTPEAIAAAAASMQEQQIHCTQLKVQTAYHSRQMTSLEERFLAGIADLESLESRCPVYSTVVGQAVDAVRLGPAHWWSNVRQPVQLAGALDAAMADGHRVFVEVGPHPVLSPLVRDRALRRGESVVVATTLRRGENDAESMAETVCQLYRAGCPIDFSSYFEPGEFVELPPRSWSRRRFWVESPESARQRLGDRPSPLLHESQEGPLEQWLTRLSPRQVAFLSDHVVAGTPVIPAALYMEMAVEAGQRLFAGEPFQIERLRFESLAQLERERHTKLRLVVGADRRQFTIHVEQENEQWQLCCRGRYSVASEARLLAVDAKEEVVSSQSLGTSLSNDDRFLCGSSGVAQAYRELKRYGLRYGPAFRPISAIARLGNGAAITQLDLPSDLDPSGFAMHPVLIDGGLQAVIAAARDAGSGSLFPVSVERFRIFGQCGRRVRVHARVVRQTARTIRAHIDYYTDAGEPVAAVSDFQCQLIPAPKEQLESRLRNWLYGEKWVELPSVPASSPQHRSAWQLWTDEFDDPKACAPGSNVIDLRFSRLAPEPSGADLVCRATDAAERLLATLTSLANRAARYVLVTERALPATPADAAPAVLQAPLVSIVDAAALEFPELEVLHLDFDSAPRRRDEILRHVGPTNERTIAVRRTKRLAPRVVRVDPKFVRHEAALTATPDESYNLEVAQRGRFDGLCFRPVARRAPGAGEIELRVRYAPLAFKDAMKVLDLLPDDVLLDTLSGESLGMEGVGQVVRVGSNVEDFSESDWVYGIAPGFLKSYVTLPSEYALQVPSGMDPLHLTSLSVYATAFLGLVECARLKNGETVLIHNATGGVGLAAIEVARHVGAEVIATAGSESKREFLRQERGVARVSDSRSRAFVDDVCRWTGGKGVDAVIGSLPAEATSWNLQCLARFGRYVEIGKSGFDGDFRLDLSPFNECLSLIAVDLDRLMASRVSESRRLCAAVLSRLASGELPPLPTERFPACDIDQAFAKMARARHIGKIAIDMGDPGSRRASAPIPLFRSDGTYLVTGASGGFGLEVAAWLAQQGAGHLRLLSRRGPSAPGAEMCRAAIEAHGARVELVACDVSNRDALAHALDEIRQGGPPLRGVFHAAMVLDDRLLADIDRASLDRVLAPKAAGAWHLHELTRDMPLDFMVFFSSVVSLFANLGQASYAAANRFLDALAQYRKTQGLPGLSLNWGLLGETGVAARDPQLLTQLELAGIEPLSTADALGALDAALRQQRPRLAIAEVDWSRWAGSASTLAKLPRFAEVVQLAGLHAAAGHAELAALSVEALRETVETRVKEIAAKVLDCEVSSLSSQAELNDLGLDSLMRMELVAMLHQRVGVLLTASDILSASSIDNVVAIVVKAVRPDVSQTGDAQEPTSTRGRSA